MVADNMREHPSDRVDLRSDTVTQPTDEMRKQCLPRQLAMMS